MSGAKEKLRNKREVAKWGMVGALGGLVLTGMLKGRTARKWHILAGVGLLGLTYWHQTLYVQDPRRKHLPEPDDTLKVVK